MNQRSRRVAGLGIALALAALGACESDASSGGTTGSKGGAAGSAAGHGGSGGGAGSAAMGGSGGASAGAGGEDDLSSVAAELDGFVFEMKCGADVGGRLCETSRERPYPRDVDPALCGAKLVDRTVTLGGEENDLYDIDLMVEGVVEAKSYTGGEDQSDAPELPADGWYVGGRPRTGNAYNVYLLRVSDPPNDYFLNAVSTANDARLRRAVFPVKYAARVRARGKATVRLVLADPNGHATKNCAEPDGDGCSPVAVDFMDPQLLRAAGLESAPLDGQVLGLLVTGVQKTVSQ